MAIDVCRLHAALWIRSSPPRYSSGICPDQLTSRRKAGHVTALLCPLCERNDRVWFNSRANCVRDMVWYRAGQTKNLTNYLVFDFCIHQLVSRF
jgi:hypothetical protein